jgi:hypothetical protein
MFGAILFLISKDTFKTKDWRFTPKRRHDPLAFHFTCTLNIHSLTNNRIVHHFPICVSHQNQIVFTANNFVNEIVQD